MEVPPGQYRMKTVCDGLAALEKVGVEKDYIRSSSKHIDMISMITDLWNQSPFSPIREHVYGHQDASLQPLTMLAKLNNKMDLMAKRIAMEHMESNLEHQIVPTSLGIGTIICGEELISSNVKQSLYNCILHTKLVKWYSKSLGIPLCLLKAHVSWRVFEKARNEGRPGLNTFMTKWISGDTATGRVMRIRKRISHSNCPRCNAPDEHTTHVLQCQTEDTCNMRLDILTEFRVWLQSVHTHSDIECFLFNGITSWLTMETCSYEPNTTGDPILQIEFRRQTLIGWEALLNGFIVKGLIEYQQQYYKTLGMRKTGNRWGAQLVNRMWTIIQSHWIHRNQCLHETEALARLSGVDDLKTAIAREYELGLGELPSVYTSYFIPPLAFILDKPTTYIRRWFLVVRSGRESFTIDNDIDIFSIDSSLRAWVGVRAF